MTHDQNKTTDLEWRSETLAETRERLRRSWGDYPLTILIINPINIRLVRIIGLTSITPNQLTIVSFLFMLSAAICISSVKASNQAIGAVLLLVGYFIDCLDGDLARLKGQKSPLGAMLDPILDRFGEFAIASGASICGWRLSGSPYWLIGGVILVGMSQIYFYLVDAMIWKLPKEIEREKKTNPIKFRGTRVRFGAIEPYIWGQTALAFLGIAYWGIPLFGTMFTLGCAWTLFRFIIRARKLDKNYSEEFGTHTR